MRSSNNGLRSDERATANMTLQNDVILLHRSLVWSFLVVGLFTLNDSLGGAVELFGVNETPSFLQLLRESGFGTQCEQTYDCEKRKKFHFVIVLTVFGTAKINNFFSAGLYIRFRYKNKRLHFIDLK